MDLEQISRHLDGIFAEYSMGLKGKEMYAVQHLRTVVKKIVQQAWVGREQEIKCIKDSSNKKEQEEQGKEEKQGKKSSKKPVTKKK